MANETGFSCGAQHEPGPSRSRPSWYGVLSDDRKPSTWKAGWQLVNTLVPYLALWGLMVLSIRCGCHPVHHLSPRIPNYRLKHCYDAVPALQAKRPLTIKESLSCLSLKLWDEERKSLVGFSGPADDGDE